MAKKEKDHGASDKARQHSIEFSDFHKVKGPILDESLQEDTASIDPDGASQEMVPMGAID